ncbi:MAG: GntR family transcriptional regulator [Mesorhizobium sp.]|uniref:GntR family transcriptional regulator n=1 Tax=unclassified Mesorhizobium TaxID=325217 RepID=UPI000FCAE36D|nr:MULTISPECIES: GntR family transcriptional regulator [unclassified Mesorhizobium]RUV71887.1 GntR family transcriptional regulator [Mesorhizobium sp. M5C.F.Cr.IN.023.01.1.1]RWF86794.1 MAG: GntR family transcriptional regulator [Mesorhizobium sp.]RWF94814.1 MAG: GntR family transcriptional regulator [Mesorhizobium sp.]RWI41527.1 MAG: GntR family transcriptional regulator [Mesorhizobium sp.]RWI48596.1 MAG: GntR family transcriptional regulator [Mesorhizobium sp.]
MDPKSIFSELQDEIESGELAPGSVLKQESIAERFGVSRQPVRQALDQLLGSGLVVRRRDRSLAVALLSEREATEPRDSLPSENLRTPRKIIAS